MPDVRDDQVGFAFGIEPKANGDLRIDADSVLGLVKGAASILTGLSGLSGVDITRDVAACVAQVLETRLRDIAIGAWNERKELRKYADSKEYPAANTYRVKLKEHSVKWTYRPYIEVSVAAIKHKVPFVVIATFTFGGPVLSIKGGRYRAIEFGEAKVVGKLELGKLTLWNKPSKTFPLPGHISLGDGIPIKANSPA